MLNGFYHVGPMVFRGCHVKIMREIKILEGFFGFSMCKSVASV